MSIYFVDSLGIFSRISRSFYIYFSFKKSVQITAELYESTTRYLRVFASETLTATSNLGLLGLISS
jgi:hypothetical protein